MILKATLEQLESRFQHVVDKHTNNKIKIDIFLCRNNIHNSLKDIFTSVSHHEKWLKDSNWSINSKLGFVFLNKLLEQTKVNLTKQSFYDYICENNAV